MQIVSTVMGVPKGGRYGALAPPWNNVISIEIGKIPNDKLVSKNRSTKFP
jgi:hypothetical protein